MIRPAPDRPTPHPSCPPGHDKPGEKLVTYLLRRVGVVSNPIICPSDALRVWREMVIWTVKRTRREERRARRGPDRLERMTKMTMKVPEMSCKFFVARTPELDLHAGTDCARDRAMTRVFSLLPSLPPPPPSLCMVARAHVHRWTLQRSNRKGSEQT